MQSKCNDMSGNCNDMQSKCNDMSGNCNDMSGNCNDMSGNCNDMSGNCNDMSGNCNDTSGNYNGMSGNCNDTSGKCNDTSGKCNDTSGKCNDTSGKCNDTGGKCNDTGRKCNDTSGKCNDTGGKCNDTGGKCNGGTIKCNLFSGFSQYPKMKPQIDTGITKALDLSKKKLYYESLTSAPKTNSRSALVNASLNLSGKMESLSIINENPQLYDSVKITKSSIKLLNDGLFLQKCELLAEAAEDNETDLEEYGETPATIGDYKKLIATFSAEVSNMADIEEQLGNVTEEFVKQLKQNEKVFKKVDSLVNTMSESQPDFYNMYFSVRSQKPTGGSKVTAKVKVYDAATRQPLPGATLIVEMIENTKALASGADLVKNVKVKSAGGGLDLKGYTTGAYLFTVSYAGCNTNQTTVYINEGVLTRVDFPMSKIA